LLNGIDQFLVVGVDQNRVGKSLVRRDFLGVPVLLDRLDIRRGAGCILSSAFAVLAVALPKQEGERQRDEQDQHDLRDGRDPGLRRFEGG
jgi:hypothetical protein